MKFLSSLLVVLIVGTTFSQQHSITSSEIYEKVQKLNFLGSVLYVAAHPDDENTTLISHYSNYNHARVGYISLTRGDGGQNLISSEIRELLGAIRTEELLAARRVDGGEQYFSRANDFGYSKLPDETFEFWDKDEVLSDLVYVIRQFKPDVIINRFDHRTPGTTHGHHTASAMLSVEAFDISNDKAVYPEQLKTVDIWQPTRQFFNISWFFYGSQEKLQKAMSKTDFLQVNVGNYYPTRGMSNMEISAISRSQHKSQGFGAESKRGDYIEYLEPVKGDWKKDYSTIFAGIDTTWNRVEGGKEIGEILNKLQHDFDFKEPSNNIPEFLKAYRKIKNLKDDHWREIKLKEIQEIIMDCAGMYFLASTNEEFSTRGDKINLNIEVVNRSSAKVSLKNYQLSRISVEKQLNKSLNFNEKWTDKIELSIPENANYSTPYWLEEEGTLGMYKVADKNLIGQSNSPKELTISYNIEIDGEEFTITQPIQYRYVSPIDGEVIKPFSVVPKISVAMNDKTMVFADNEPKEVKVTVKGYQDDLKGKVSLQFENEGQSWKITPEFIEVNILKKGMEETVSFLVQPTVNEVESIVKPVFELNGEQFDKQVHLLDFDHINAQTVLLPAKMKVNRIDIQKKGNTIGYIIGAGDDVPASLRAIGYNVTEFLPKEITADKLQQFDAVVLGIRAYDLDNDLPLYQNVLFDYIKNGGTVITQYNSTRELKTDRLAPFKLKLSHDRVTDEHSEVIFLEKKHPILNSPNEITQKDFDGWVQERGLYFANQWGKEFTPILGMHDKGEKTLKGSLLVAEYGEGYFVYTGISFFRELPAGVSGAYRLFANLLSLGK